MLSKLSRPDGKRISVAHQTPPTPVQNTLGMHICMTGIKGQVGRQSMSALRKMSNVDTSALVQRGADSCSCLRRIHRVKAQTPWSCWYENLKGWSRGKLFGFLLCKAQHSQNKLAFIPKGFSALRVDLHEEECFMCCNKTVLQMLLSSRRKCEPVGSI